MRSSGKRFFRKTLKTIHNQTPRVITVDKNADTPKALNELKAKKELPKSVELQQKKYLFNIASAGESNLSVNASVHACLDRTA